MPKSSDDERVSDWLGLAIELRIYVLAALFIVLENARILAPLIYVEEAQDSSQAQYGEDCFNDVVSGFLSFGFIVEGHTVRNIFASFEVLYAIFMAALLFATRPCGYDEESKAFYWHRFARSVFILLTAVCSIGVAASLFHLDHYLKQYLRVEEMLESNLGRELHCDNGDLYYDSRTVEKASTNAKSLYKKLAGMVVGSTITALVNVLPTSAAKFISNWIVKDKNSEAPIKLTKTEITGDHCPPQGGSGSIAQGDGASSDSSRQGDAANIRTQSYRRLFGQGHAVEVTDASSRTAPTSFAISVM